MSRTRVFFEWLEDTKSLTMLLPAQPRLWPEQQLSGLCCHLLSSLFLPLLCAALRGTLSGRKLPKKGMRREKSLSSNQLVCLLLLFLSQTTGCLELIYLRPNPLQLRHSFGQGSFCCVVCCAFGLLYLLVR